MKRTTFANFSSPYIVMWGSQSGVEVMRVFGLRAARQVAARHNGVVETLAGILVAGAGEGVEL